MLHMSDLPEEVPIFPLPGALLLPRTRLPLHIFEPRFLQMLDDTLKTPHRLIGMVQPMPVPEGEESNALHTIGCAGRVTQFSETEDGRYMITLAGVSRFHVTKEIDSFTPYRRCSVSWDNFGQDLGAPEVDPDFDRERFLSLLGRYFASQSLSTDWEALKEADDELLINSLSMLCPFSAEEKQALLEAKALRERRETLATLLDFATRESGSNEERLQ